MRTKTLLMAGAALALSLATSQAQVYSANVVGYINAPIQGGLNLIANPLSNGNGNTADIVLPTLPDGSFVYTYNNAFTIYVVYGGVYYDPNTFAQLTPPTIAPGSGVFVNNGGSTFTNTYVGSVSVPLGGSATNNLPAALALTGSLLPVPGGLTSVLNLNPPDGTFVYILNGVGGFNISVVYGGVYYDPNTFAVLPEPQIAIGQGFFVNASSATAWGQTLTP